MLWLGLMGKTTILKGYLRMPKMDILENWLLTKELEDNSYQIFEWLCLIFAFLQKRFLEFPADFSEILMRS